MVPAVNPWAFLPLQPLSAVPVVLPCWPCRRLGFSRHPSPSPPPGDGVPSWRLPHCLTLSNPCCTLMPAVALLMPQTAPRFKHRAIVARFAVPFRGHDSRPDLPQATVATPGFPKAPLWSARVKRSAMTPTADRCNSTVMVQARSNPAQQRPKRKTSAWLAAPVLIPRLAQKGSGSCAHWNRYNLPKIGNAF